MHKDCGKGHFVEVLGKLRHVYEEAEFPHSYTV